MQLMSMGRLMNGNPASGRGGSSAQTWDVTSLDFSSGLASGTSLARAQTRTRFNSAGEMDSVTSGNPALEWTSALAAQGIHVAGSNGLSNLLLQAAHLGTTWTNVSLSSLGTGEADPLGGTAAFALIENSSSANHGSLQTLTSGTIGVADSGYVMALVKASTRTIVSLISTNSTVDLNSNYILDPDYPFTYNQVNSSVWTNQKSGIIKVGDNGYFLIWQSGTRTCAVDAKWDTRIYMKNASGVRPYLGDGASKVIVYGLQVQIGKEVPSWFKDTTTTALAQVQDALTISDASTVSAIKALSQGTFYWETDALSGQPLLGTDATTLISHPAFTASGTVDYTTPYMHKICMSFDGSGVTFVIDGGSAISGAALGAWGTTIGLLCSSAAAANAHLKAFKVSSTKLSTAQMQAQTALTASTSGTPGAVRGLATRNTLANNFYTTSGNNLRFIGRIPYVVGTEARTTLRGWWSNFYSSPSGETSTGNTVNITEAAWEYNGASYPVYFSGGRTKALASGDYAILDDGVSTSTAGFGASIAVGETVWLRVSGSVTTTGHKLPVGRNMAAEPANSSFWVYDTADAVTTMSAIDSTGAIAKVSGSGSPTAITGLYFSPIVLGTVALDKPTFISVGDSISIGSGSTVGAGGNSFVHLGLASINGNPQALILCGASSSDCLDWVGSNTKWQSLLQYARVAIQEHGANVAGTADMSGFESHYTLIKAIYAGGIQKIIKVSQWPSSTSTDSWATIANQTLVSGNVTLRKWMDSAAKARCFDYYCRLPSTRYSSDPTNVNYDAWNVTGAANAYATDQTHPSQGGHVAGGADLAVTVTQCVSEMG
jgi:hypothetical protein